MALSEDTKEKNGRTSVNLSDRHELASTRSPEGDPDNMSQTTSEEYESNSASSCTDEASRVQVGGEQNQVACDDEKAIKCHRSLARRWSTPARSKSLATCEEDQQAPASLHGKYEGVSIKESEQHQRQRQQQKQRQQQVFHRNKSVSSLRPTSSSASDSAFSQSQTTLGSENGSDTERAKDRSLGDNDRLSSDGSNGSGDSGSSSSGSSLSQDQNHFRIVWRKLSYRIPEKRFARALAYAAKLREKWTPKEDEPVPDDDEDYQPKSIVTGTARHDRASFDCQSISDVKRPSCVHDKLESGLCPAVAPMKPTASAKHLKLSKLHNKQRTTIFSGLNGCVKSGQLTAILGPSGAGKTTFLNCLTNSITKGVSGSITIHNGKQDSTHSAEPTTTSRSASSQHLKLCIIPQKDYLFDNLTVMENLLFASRIKNTQANFDHEENVYRITNLLGLLACLKLKTSRLSGGQYKRVSIAQELLSQPDILILDEPTSGLDSLTCFRTVSVLRDLADLSQSGLMPPLAIIMTIHQPQIKIFNLFHHVYVLSALGQCVYEGRPGYLLDTVEDRCKLLPPPDDQNPASFIIDVASEVYGTKPIEQLMDLHKENFDLIHSRDIGSGAAHEGTAKQRQPLALVDTFEGLVSSVGKRQSGNNDAPMVLVKTKKGHNQSLQNDNNDEQLVISNQLRKRYNHEQNFWLHTRLLIKRHWISTWRDSLLTKTRVTFHLIIPFVFYCIYSQKSGSANACPHVERELDVHDLVSDSNIERLAAQHDELILTFENVSLFFILLYSFSMCVLAVTALSFPLNMQILLKETANGWYTMPRFVMAKTLADLPIELTMPMISVSIAYTLTGQPGSYLCWRMLAVTAIMTLCSLISQTQGLLYGAWFMNNVQAAVFVSQATSLPWIMLSGFTTRVSQLPTVLQWLSFGSIYRLGIESIMTVRYGFGMCPCDADLVNETVPKIVGIPDNLKSVMSYYMEMHAETSQELANSTHSNLANAVLPSNSSTQQGDIFSKLASTLTRANTYGVNIVSCDDVKPFILTAREVDESTLPVFLSVLFAVLIALKILLFYVVRLRTS